MLSVSTSPRGVPHTPTRDRYMPLGSGVAPAAWGGISGSIPSQTDLQAALDAKLPVSTSAIAGEILNGQRAVYVAADGKAYLADQSSVTSVRTMGLCQGAVILGATASIQTCGVLTEPSWTWTGDALVWLAASGQLTQTPPTTGYLVKVGVPVGPTKLLIAPQIMARLT